MRGHVDGEHPGIEINVRIHIYGNTCKHLSGTFHILPYFGACVYRCVRIVDNGTNTTTEVVEYTVVCRFEVIDQIATAVFNRTTRITASGIGLCLFNIIDIEGACSSARTIYKEGKPRVLV